MLQGRPAQHFAALALYGQVSQGKWLLRTYWNV